MKEYESIKNLTNVQLMKLFDDAMLYNNRDLMHKVDTI